MAQLVGTPDADVLTGTTADDIIEGLAGDDTLVGGGGFDAIADGAGSDRCHIDGSGGEIFADATDADARDWYFGVPAEGETFIYSEATTVYYEAASQPVIVNLKTGVARGVEIGWDRLADIQGVIGGSGDDVILGTDQSANGFFGRDGGDTMYGYGGSDRLDGESGNDRLYGGDGDDELNGGEGENLIRGGGGNDVLNAFSIALSGLQRLFGDDGDDLIYGGFGDDRISGGGGNDRIYGLNGQNIMIGGTGADRFETVHMAESLDMAGKCDVIVDFEDGIDRLAIRNTDLSAFLDGARTISTGIAIDLGFGAILQMRNFTLAQFDASDFVVT